MNVFLSWSGQLSHTVASELHRWLPVVVPGVQPWISSSGIKKGVSWVGEIRSKLRDGTVGIFCLTHENLDSEWLNFEAGALSNTDDSGNVSTLLLRGLKPRDVPAPLSVFQSTNWDRQDVRKLVGDLNAGLKAPSSAEALDQRFNAFWNDLDIKVSKAFAEYPRVIYLADMARAKAVYAGEEYVGVEFKGPAIMGMRDCEFKRCGFGLPDGATVDSLLWEVPRVDGERRMTVGTLGFVQCKFLNCKFESVGFAGSTTFIAGLRQQMLDILKSP